MRFQAISVDKYKQWRRLVGKKIIKKNNKKKNRSPFERAATIRHNSHVAFDSLKSDSFGHKGGSNEKANRTLGHTRPGLISENMTKQASLQQALSARAPQKITTLFSENPQTVFFFSFFSPPLPRALNSLARLKLKNMNGIR